MPVVVLFIIFILLLVIAVPVSITLGITSVLPSVCDPSFTVGAKYLIRAIWIPSRCSPFQCSYCPASSWQKVESPRNYSMSSLIFSVNSPLECHALLS